MEQSNSNHHNALLKLVHFSFSKIVQEKALSLIRAYRDQIQYIEKEEKRENELNENGITFKKEYYYSVPSEGKEGMSYIVDAFKSSNNDAKDICTCAALYPCKHMYLVGLWVEDLLNQNDKDNGNNNNYKNPNNDVLESNGMEKGLLLFQPKIVLREDKKNKYDGSKKRKNFQSDDGFENHMNKKDVENNNNKHQRKNNITFDQLIEKGILKPTNKLYYQEKGMDQPIWFAYVNEEDGKVVDDKTRTVVYKTPAFFAKDVWKHNYNDNDNKEMVQQKTHFYGNILYKNIRVVEQDHQSLFYLMNIDKTT